MIFAVDLTFTGFGIFMPRSIHCGWLIDKYRKKIASEGRG
jgi:hypothetical protein